MGRRNKRHASEEGPREPWKVVAAVTAMGRFILELYRALKDGLVDHVRDFLKSFFNG